MPTVRIPRVKRDWEGRYVRLKRKMETKGGDVFEAGEVMRVDRNYGGLHLSVVRHCSVCKKRHRGRINRVSEDDVRLLPEDYRPEEDLFSVYALRAKVEKLEGDLEWREEQLTKAKREILAYEPEVEDLRAEVERLRELAVYSTEDGTQAYWRDIAEAKTETIARLRRACIQVRKWGIELASLQPDMRERRFCQLWPHINDALRTAALQAESEDSQC
jgi:hypothetical protein